VNQSGYDVQHIETIIHEREQKEAADRMKETAADALAKHGEIGQGRNRGAVGTSIKRGGNSLAYRCARLKRDRPDIAACRRIARE
jgi:hypothetical protein